MGATKKKEEFMNTRHAKCTYTNMDQLHVNYNLMTKSFNHIRILKCIAVTLLQTQHFYRHNTFTDTTQTKDNTNKGQNKQRVTVCSGDFKMHTNKGTAFKINHYTIGNNIILQRNLINRLTIGINMAQQ